MKEKMLYSFRDLFKLMGLHVSKKSFRNCETEKLRSLFSINDIDCVIDVGANIGQYGMLLQELNFSGQIISFEPLLEAYSNLVKVSAPYNNWFIHPRCALGSMKDEAIINVSENLASSSILNITDLHINSAPASTYVGKERIIIDTLDSALQKYDLDNKKIHLKIDTQGYELEVLLGAGETLKIISSLQVEASFGELYKDQPDFNKINTFAHKCGFEIRDIYPMFYSESGRLLQADIFYARSVIG